MNDNKDNDVTTDNDVRMAALQVLAMIAVILGAVTIVFIATH